MPTKPLPPAMKDPLLAAVVGKLPPAGSSWTEYERDSWFDMMRKATAVSYQIRRPESASGSLVQPSDSTITATRYYIEPDGTARADERFIDPHNIPPNTVVHDYRPQPVDDELNPIMWLTQGAKALRLPAGVVLRPAKEPMPTAAALNGSAEAEA